MKATLEHRGVEGPTLAILRDHIPMLSIYNAKGSMLQ